MADIADVEVALATLASAVLYPGGTTSPSAISAPARVLRGWVNPDELDKAIAAGMVTVTASQRPGMGRETTRFPREWREVCLPPGTLAATATGNAFTITGTPSVGDLIGLRLGGLRYVQTIAAFDTPASAAAALAARIPGATASGVTVTVPPGAADFLARVATPRRMIRELRRQEHHFQVIVWAPNPALRDAACRTIDAALAAEDFVALADGSSARIRYVATATVEAASRSAVWRRDLHYAAEFATTEVRDFPTILFGVVASEAGVDTV